MTENKDSNKQPLSPALEYIKKSWKENGFDENEPVDFSKLSKKVLEPHTNIIASSNSSPSTFISNTQKIAMEAEEKRKRERKEDIEIANKQTEYLKDIKENTTILKEMNYHLELNNAHQREIIDLTIEALSIMKSSDQEEAENKLDKFKKKVEFLNTLNDSKETAKWLISMAKSAYIMFLTLSS